LPKGVGALKGIAEKLEVDSANGSAGFTIPYRFPQRKTDKKLPKNQDGQEEI